MPHGYQTSDEKTWSLIAHFGGIIGFIPSLVVFLVKGSQSQTVRAHAVRALNFQIVVSGTLLVLSLVNVCGGFFLPSAVSLLLSLASTAVWLGGVVFALAGDGGGVELRFPRGRGFDLELDDLRRRGLDFGG